MAVLPNIAITGALRSGKDTVGEYLAERYGYVRFAFGDGIRDICRRLYPDQFVDGKKPRALLQGVGQTLRTFDEDVWVRQCFTEIDWHRKNNEALNASIMKHGTGTFTPLPFRAVITDLRQPNEMARCRAEGFVIIRVKATSGLRIQRAVESADTFVLSDLTHETEQHTDGFAVDYEICNDGTLAELYAKVDEVIAELTNRQH